MHHLQYLRSDPTQKKSPTCNWYDLQGRGKSGIATSGVLVGRLKAFFRPTRVGEAETLLYETMTAPSSAVANLWVFEHRENPTDRPAQVGTGLQKALPRNCPHTPKLATARTTASAKGKDKARATGHGVKVGGEGGTASHDLPDVQ